MTWPLVSRHLVDHVILSDTLPRDQKLQKLLTVSALMASGVTPAGVTTASASTGTERAGSGCTESLLMLSVMVAPSKQAQASTGRLWVLYGKAGSYLGISWAFSERVGAMGFTRSRLRPAYSDETDKQTGNR